MVNHGAVLAIMDFTDNKELQEKFFSLIKVIARNTVNLSDDLKSLISSLSAVFAKIMPVDVYFKKDNR